MQLAGINFIDFKLVLSLPGNTFTFSERDLDIADLGRWENADSAELIRFRIRPATFARNAAHAQ